MSDSVTLDGYRVMYFTERAVLVRHMATGRETWVPKSVCDSGDRLEIGDTDIMVAEWFADKEGLIF